MLNKINYKSFDVRAQLDTFIEEAERMVAAYGWENKVTHPYAHCPVKVTKIINDLKDYDRCTRGSQDYLISLANGFADVLNSWEKYELAPKIKVRIIATGDIAEVTHDTAEYMKEYIEII